MGRLVEPRVCDSAEVTELKPAELMRYNSMTGTKTLIVFILGISLGWLWGFTSDTSKLQNLADKCKSVCCVKEDCCSKESCCVSDKKCQCATGQECICLNCKCKDCKCHEKGTCKGLKLSKDCCAEKQENVKKN